MKQPWYIYAGVLGLLGVLSLLYTLQCFQRYQQYQQLLASVKDIQQADAIILQQEETRNQLDKAVGRLKPGSQKVLGHNSFIQYVEQLCETHNVRLVSLPREYIRKMGRYEVAEIQVSFEGSYKNILKVLFQIEYADRLASTQKLDLHMEEIRQDYERVSYLVADITFNRLIT